MGTQNPILTTKYLLKKMTVHIYTCLTCKSYTLQQEHCGSHTIQPKPPKFSLEDKYAHLRRKAKKQEREQKCLV